MNTILEKILEPEEIYTGSFFKLKVKIQPDTLHSLNYRQMAQLTWQEVKEMYTFNTLKGD